jgi:hypothetical protein
MHHTMAYIQFEWHIHRCYGAFKGTLIDTDYLINIYIYILGIIN